MRRYSVLFNFPKKKDSSPVLLFKRRHGGKLILEIMLYVKKHGETSILVKVKVIVGVVFI